MGVLMVERLGGLAGMGVPNSRIRSRGQIPFANLSEVDRKQVSTLLDRAGTTGDQKPIPDGFRYRLSHITQSGTRTVEVPESAVPDAIKQCVRDELL